MGKAVLLRSKAVFIEYLYQKIVAEDWHGVSDVANDLRELEIRLELSGGNIFTNFGKHLDPQSQIMENPYDEK